MNDNVLTALVYIGFFAVQLVGVAVIALVYDRWSSRKRRVGDNYRCGSCGFVFPQKGIQLSGWEDHPHGVHVNCPNCGSTVDQFVNVKELASKGGLS